MGDITLGCLLGQYDGAQSFDVASEANPARVGSWFALQTDHTALQYWGANESGVLATHSSDQGLRVVCTSYGVNSGALDGALRYDYSPGNDAWQRARPDVTTHDVRTDVWARLDVGPYSGSAVIQLDDTAVAPIPYTAAASMAHLRAATTTWSGKNPIPPHLDVDIRSHYPTAYDIYLDSVLTQIDPIVLHPGYDAAWQQRLLRGDARTPAGQLYSTLWGSYFAYSLPLQFLPDAHASLLNWWWQQQFSLCLTLDTSDAESLHLVRIVNASQPIGKRMAPYTDLWQGVLQLESLDAGSLVF